MMNLVQETALHWRKQSNNSTTAQLGFSVNNLGMDDCNALTAMQAIKRNKAITVKFFKEWAWYW